MLQLITVCKSTNCEKTACLKFIKFVSCHFFHSLPLGKFLSGYRQSQTLQNNHCFLLTLKMKPAELRLFFFKYRTYLLTKKLNRTVKYASWRARLIWSFITSQLSEAIRNIFCFLHFQYLLGLLGQNGIVTKAATLWRERNPVLFKHICLFPPAHIPKISQRNSPAQVSCVKKLKEKCCKHVGTFLSSWSI